MKEGWMKDEWRMNEEWMKDEWRMMKDEWWGVMYSSCQGVLQTDKQMDIGDCRVAFATEKGLCNLIGSAQVFCNIFFQLPNP